MVDNQKPYEQAYFPPKPTGATKFFRNCAIWQLIRFVVLNLKMLKVVGASHH
jgi:hypothetical protein